MRLLGNGGAGDDRIQGNSGDDLLRGGGGNDVYIYGLDDGNDTIRNTGGGATSNDVLSARDFIREQFTFHRDGSDVEIRIHDLMNFDLILGTVTVDGWFSLAGGKIDELRAQDGVFTSDDIESLLQQGKFADAADSGLM